MAVTATALQSLALYLLTRRRKDRNGQAGSRQRQLVQIVSLIEVIPAGIGIEDDHCAKQADVTISAVNSPWRE